MREAIIFLLGTVFFVWVSWHALRRPFSHGFYRFFAWECILALFVLNAPSWTDSLLVPRQIVSWVLLFLSPVLAIHGVMLLRRIGRPTRERQEADLLSFERTSTLVTEGAYRYIRHPMYASLLFLAWGIFLKNISGPSMALVGVATVTLVLTALRDEAECRNYFGAPYAEYMKRTKRFVPFLF